MRNAEAICNDIDQVLAERTIEFLVREHARGFLYGDMPVSVGVLSEGQDSALSLGAVVVSHVELGTPRARARLLARLEGLKKDFPDAMLELTEENQVVWTFRLLDLAEFTTESFLHELDELTKTAAEIAPTARGRLATGNLGTETELVGLQQPRSRSNHPRQTADRTATIFLEHLLGLPPRFLC